jgi:hypothetical protein
LLRCSTCHAAAAASLLLLRRWCCRDDALLELANAYADIDAMQVQQT